jgi:hypothetical protein
VNGGIQNASSIFVPNGSICFQLNVDATVIAPPYGFVGASLEVTFQFDATGNLVQPAQLYSNAELNPQNGMGLGTYYLVTVYDQNGARINQDPMWWQFTEAAGATVDISAMTPYATVGGNVIFYPTLFIIGPPGPSTLGGVFSNAGSPHHWVSAINTDGSVALTQPSFADISGTIDPSQLPAAGGSVVYSGTVTAQTALIVGLTGTTAGQLTLAGGTSGTATITAPAIAGVVANPILFSNSISLAAGGSVLAPGGVSTVQTLNPTGAQATFRQTDSELTLGAAVTSVTGSVAAVRGNTTLATGATITGASYLYGTQGKLTVQGALNSTAYVSAGIVGQLDLSTASASSAPIAAGWFDCGATASAAIISSPAAIDGIVIYNTTAAIINSVIRAAANANFLFDATDLAGGGQHFVQLSAVNTGDLANVKIAVKVDGVTYYLPLYTA